ncbi:MAG: TonB-dependent receptor [Alphaproteobacteria bacterium]|nr:MAG: TonB-dependent receptor [Alphaproteobacteria bacterium]
MSTSCFSVHSHGEWQLLALAASLVCGLSAPALAQEQATTQENQPRANVGIEEIMVTAQKREEGLQSVPISIAAVSGAKMDSLHATNLEALQGYIPNVQIQSFANVSHGAVFNIRGMGVIEPDPYAGTTVQVVEDGVPQFFNMTALLDTFDIDRVEVLRGPQGTLFGANSTGGVVQVVNRKPTGELGMRAEASIGNYDMIKVKGSLDFPVLKDVLAARVTATHLNRDGFITNIVDGSDMGGRNRTAVRVQLEFTPNEAFETRLIGTVSRHRDSGEDSVNGDVPGEALFVPAGTEFPSPAFPDAVARFSMPASPCLPAGQRCRAPKKFLSANGSDIPPTSDMDTYGATLQMTWRADFGTLTSITGYKDFKLHDINDQDWTPVFFDDTERLTDGWQFSQELRGDFQLTDWLDVMAGGFYAQYAWDHFQDFRIQFALPGLRQLTQDDWNTETASAFLQGYANLTDRLRLQGGVRITYEKTEAAVRIANFLDSRGAADLRGKGLNEIAGPFEDFLGDITPSDQKSWTNLGGKFGFEYDALEDAMFYGYYAHGFKSGGFVGRIVNPIDIGPFNQEQVDTIELGVKSEWLDNRLRLNLSAFHNWYDDIQLAVIFFTQDQFGNTVNGNSIINAASARTKGLEAEVIAVPVNGLTLSSSLGFLDATYSNFPFIDPTTLIETNLKGERLQNAPKWTIATSVNYVFYASGFAFTTNIGYNYVGKKFNTNLQNTPRSLIQNTHLVDGSFDVGPENGNWSVGVWVKNMFDNRYISSVFDAPGVIGLVDYQDPRTFGVSFRMEM